MLWELSEISTFLMAQISFVALPRKFTWISPVGFYWAVTSNCRRRQWRHWYSCHVICRHVANLQWRLYRAKGGRGAGQKWKILKHGNFDFFSTGLHRGYTLSRKKSNFRGSNVIIYFSTAPFKGAHPSFLPPLKPIVKRVFSSTPRWKKKISQETTPI